MKISNDLYSIILFLAVYEIDGHGTGRGGAGSLKILDWFRIKKKKRKKNGYLSSRRGVFYFFLPLLPPNTSAVLPVNLVRPRTPWGFTKCLLFFCKKKTSLYTCGIFLLGQRPKKKIQRKRGVLVAKQALPPKSVEGSSFLFWVRRLKIEKKKRGGGGGAKRKEKKRKGKEGKDG